MGNKEFRICAAAALCLVALARGADEKKISLFTAVDLGRVESGYDKRKNFDPSGLALNRTYVDVGFMQQLNPNYFISIGVGGIFWKAYEGDGGNPEDKVIKFGPGISNAYMNWAPGGGLDLSFGYFPYKYNQAAKNLGEYLFRTEAYPTIIYTGGWEWINDVQYRTVGAKLTWTLADGRFKQDIGLFGEYFNSPIYDITPAYIATWKPASGITLGGAASLHRYLSPNPKVTRELTRAYAYHENFYFPETKSKRTFNVALDNSIATFPGYEVAYSAGSMPDTVALKEKIFTENTFTLSLYNITSADQVPIKMDTAKSTRREGRAAERATKLRADIMKQSNAETNNDSTYFNDPNNAGNNPKQVSFDLAAVKLLAFFELDFNGLLGLNAQDMGTFNIYGEVAQLGLKNYPIFYTKYSERMPIMLGLSVPTFGLLNTLSLEVEYLKNPNMESIASTYDVLDLPPDPAYRYQVYTRDDLKWSFYASRSISKFFTLFVQVANDHMRLKDGFARPEYVPVTNTPSHWYWLSRIQWAI